MLPSISSRRRFADLTEQEVLALAISSEEDDARIYRSYAERSARGLSRPRPRCSTAWPRKRTSIASA